MGSTYHSYIDNKKAVISMASAYAVIFSILGIISFQDPLVLRYAFNISIHTMNEVES